MFCLTYHNNSKYRLILLSEYKEALQEDADGLTDEELQRAIDLQTQFANIIFDYWQDKINNK